MEIIMSEAHRINLHDLETLWGKAFTEECIAEGFKIIVNSSTNKEDVVHSVPIELILAVAIQKVRVT
jgi:hypothetical protein